eukprot:137146_1
MARESEEYNLSLENWQSLRDALQFNVEVLHDLECTVCGETLGRGFAKRIRLEECAGCMLLLRAAQTRQKSLEVFKLKCSTLKIEQKDIQTNKDKADGDLTLFKTNEYNLTKQIEAKQIAIDSEEIQYHDAVQQENVRHERLLRSLKEQTGIRMDELNEEMRVFKQKQNEAVDEVRICAQKIEQYLKELEAISYEKFSADKEYNEKEELASQVFDCEYGAIKSNVRTAVQGSQSVCSAPTRDGNEESNPYGYEYNEEEATRDGNEETPHGNETTRDGNEETQSYGSEKPQSYGYEDTTQQSYGNEDTTQQSYGYEDTIQQSYGNEDTTQQSYGYEDAIPQSYGNEAPNPSSSGRREPPRLVIRKGAHLVSSYPEGEEHRGRVKYFHPGCGWGMICGEVNAYDIKFHWNALSSVVLKNNKPYYCRHDTLKLPLLQSNTHVWFKMGINMVHDRRSPTSEKVPSYEAIQVRLGNGKKIGLMQCCAQCKFNMKSYEDAQENYRKITGIGYKPCPEYNNPYVKCSYVQCRYRHICANCRQQHPQYECR